VTARVAVRCVPTGDGWSCTVVVGDDPAATTHDVRVERGDLATLAPGATPEWLVEASFAFLLQREPRESILRSFDLPVIERYFPEYRSELGRRLA
jgi:hypothetical protein